MLVLGEDPLLPLVLISIRGGFRPAAWHVPLVNFVHLHGYHRERDQAVILPRENRTADVIKASAR